MTLPLIDALLLGVVEGLTEFLPVSSTGHLILASHLLGRQKPAAAAGSPEMTAQAIDAYLVIIQLGALLAAVWYYRRTYLDLATGLLKRQPAAQRLFKNLCLAALPVLAIGYLASKWIKAHLFGPTTVAAALLVGGIVMLFVERFVATRQKSGASHEVLAISSQQALIIGLVQACALWPGTSRSMSCIVGGQLAGLGTAAAAEFTFLLALPTLGVATLYELLKGSRELIEIVGPASMALGLVMAFLVGLLCIAGFLRYLKRFGLWPFGCYRIIFGLLLLGLL